MNIDRNWLAGSGKVHVDYFVIISLLDNCVSIILTNLKAFYAKVIGKFSDVVYYDYEPYNFIIPL
jgi:hypothetical protein